MIKYKTNLNCNLNEFHNWNITDVHGGVSDARSGVFVCDAYIKHGASRPHRYP